MIPAGELAVYGSPFAVLACAAAWAQRYTWSRPPKTARQARVRAAWLSAPVLPQFGVRIGSDRFIYSMLSGRCLGPLDGATAAVAKSVPVTSLKPSTGWCTITFADGTVHRSLFALRNLPEAQAQLAKFQALAAATPQGQFRRTRPASMTP